MDHPDLLQDFQAYERGRLEELLVTYPNCLLGFSESPNLSGTESRIARLQRIAGPESPESMQREAQNRVEPQ